MFNVRGLHAAHEEIGAGDGHVVQGEGKSGFGQLELRWSQSGGNRPRQHSVSEEEEVVDALKPVNRIRRLSVSFYNGARSPKWMGDPSWVSTSLLVEVKLFNCTNWEVLPPLGQLPCLKFLEIWRMSGVRRIGPEFKLAPWFPSLEELHFWDMPEWEEWESPVVLLEQQQQQQQHPLFLPRLRTLRLEYCEKLRELPPLPPTLTSLRLVQVGLTRLPGWMERCSDDDIGRDEVMMPASTSTSSSPSRMLSTLEISYCPNITSLDDGLRSLGATTGLVSLKWLTIRGCPKLLHLVEEEGGAAAAVMSSSPVIPSSSTVVVPKKIISLKELYAWSCSPKQLATWLRQVSSLQELYIWRCPDLDLDLDLDLEGALLDLAPSLRTLHLYNCYNLSSLPSKLRSLTRLEKLVIENCPKIQRLPSAGLPETLKELVIRGCPELEQGCREEGCPDWPLLSHIPDVQIRD